MPYKNPKDRKKQTNKPVGSMPFEARMERQRARRKMDREGVDRNNNGKADKREGKDIDHIKPIRKGGKSVRGNLRIRSKSTNQGDNGK